MLPGSHLCWKVWVVLKAVMCASPTPVSGCEGEVVGRQFGWIYERMEEGDCGGEFSPGKGKESRHAYRLRVEKAAVKGNWQAGGR
jgi:hypothetical protein